MNTTFRWRRELVTRHHVEAGALRQPPPAMLDWLRDRSVCVVASEAVESLLADRLEAMRQVAGNWRLLPVPDGESAKSLRVAESLWSDLLGDRCTREVRLLGLGGGATTDLVGFVAASYLRGVEFALLPTTTLAQVDASVGAKSGVNLDGVKNIVGALSPPSWVLADPEVLLTEDPRQRRAGLVEVLKLGCVRDASLLAAVESDWRHLLDGDVDTLQRVIGLAVAAKLEVVETDPEEGDLRRVLNFGHTLGHALEAVSGDKELLHGEAVAWGMLFALQLSRRRCGLPEVEAERVEALIAELELPPMPDANLPDLLQAIDRDKKQTGHGLVWVLVEELGTHHLDSNLTPVELETELSRFLASARSRDRA